MLVIERNNKLSANVLYVIAVFYLAVAWLELVTALESGDGPFSVNQVCLFVLGRCFVSG